MTTRSIAQDASHPSLVEAMVETVRDLTAKYGQILIRMAAAGDRKEVHQRRRKSDFVSEIDLQLDREYAARLSQVLPSYVYVSEEGEPNVHPEGQSSLPEFLAIVDPLDTSELAVRGLYGYTQLTIYCLKTQSPVVSVVGDMFHKIQLFYAFQNRRGGHRAYFSTSESIRYGLKISQVRSLRRALVTTYSMKVRERFLRFASQQALLDLMAQPDRAGQARGRLGIDFGSIGLCHVAAGFTDAMLEVTRGFRLWDLFPGLHILTAAGGIVSSLGGQRLPLSLDIHCFPDILRILKERVKFVAVGQRTLLKSILPALTIDN